MRRIVQLLCACALALALPAAAAAGPGLFVGAAEDAPRSPDLGRAYAKMQLARLAGLDTIRVTSIWAPGHARPGDHELLVLGNVAAAGQLNGIRVVVSVYHRDQRTTPLTPGARRDFASYVATIAREIPTLRDFIIGNEPNLNLFWMPQFNRNGTTASAGAYLRLLAASYDALKAVSPDVNVIGGSVSPRGQDRPSSPRQTHSPTRFIAELGRAYRQSRRQAPVMDAFAFHPYLIPSRLPPEFRFANPRNTTIGLSDYDKLTRALTGAFRGTRQPGATLPIVYDEFGYQSEIPAAKREHYEFLDAPAARDAIPEALQAAYYRRAIAIAQCQPNVGGILLFHVSDESDARAWQSGVYYADDTPKSSLGAVRRAALEAQRGTLARCASPKRVNPVRSIVFPEAGSVAEDATSWPVRLTCDAPCRYSARIERAESPGVVSVLGLVTGATALSASGAASPGVAVQLDFPAEPLVPGAYQYVVRIFQAGRPGTAVLRLSRPFSVGFEALAPPPPAPPSPPEPEPDPEPPPPDPSDP